MAEPKLHRKGAPKDWINAQDISATTGHRIQSVLQMISSRKSQKRGSTIHTRVKGYEWKDMPGGGREKVAVWEEYEAFPSLEWPYRPQTVTHEDFFRAGGSDDFCFPEAEGLEIIRRIRTYREAHDLHVPNLPDGFFSLLDAKDPADVAEEPVEDVAELTRDQQIVQAMRTYPADGRRTKRQGWPYLRDLRKHAGIGDIKAADRKRLWPQANPPQQEDTK